MCLCNITFRYGTVRAVISFLSCLRLPVSSVYFVLYCIRKKCRAGACRGVSATLLAFLVPSAIGSGKLASYYVDCAVLVASYNASQLGFAFYYLLICLNVLIFLRCCCSRLPHVSCLVSWRVATWTSAVTVRANGVRSTRKVFMSGPNAPCCGAAPMRPAVVSAVQAISTRSRLFYQSFLRSAMLVVQMLRGCRARCWRAC